MIQKGKQLTPDENLRAGSGAWRDWMDEMVREYFNTPIIGFNGVCSCFLQIFETDDGAKLYSSSPPPLPSPSELSLWTERKISPQFFK